MPAPVTGTERAALSRDLSEFLVELSIALHRRAMYPDGHPSLAPSAQGLLRRTEALLETRPSVSLGVARRQLVIEGVATDPDHPVLRELASRLHRHQLGAITVQRGVGLEDITNLIQRLAVDAERGAKPIGRGPLEALAVGPHIKLHPLTFDQLELHEGPEGGVRAAQLWIGLARAAIMGENAVDGAPATTEPDDIARAIDAPPRTAAYDQVIVGYLLQIADELKAGGTGADTAALRRKVSRLIAALRPETVRRLVEMGGDGDQRRTFVLNAAQSWSVDAVLEIVTAAAAASGETVSHGLFRVLTKLARHATTGPEDGRQLADSALREQVTNLVTGWQLDDPNPDSYRTVLHRMATADAAPNRSETGAGAVEPLRLVQLAVETDCPTAGMWEAVEMLVSRGDVAPLAELLDQGPPQQATVRELRGRVTSAEVVRQVVTEPPDFKTLDRLLPVLEVSAIEVMLEALASSENRTTRRGLLDRLARVPVDISPQLVRWLGDDRWYVRRNMLVLLDTLPGLPEGFSPAAHAKHPDPRVRREALKVRLKLPAERDAAIAAGLGDADDQVAGLALMAAQQQCPAEAASIIARRLDPRANYLWSRELRPAAIKALGRAKSPDALHALLRLVDGGKTWLGRRRLAAKSSELVSALLALSTGWRLESRARALLLLASRSGDAEIRAAAGLL